MQHKEEYQLIRRLRQRGLIPTDIGLQMLKDEHLKRLVRQLKRLQDEMDSIDKYIKDQAE